MIILEWFLCYFLVALLTLGFAFYQKSINAQAIIVHIGLLLSSILLFIFGARLQFQSTYYGVGVFLIAVVFSIAIIRRIGVLYTISSIVQEVCLLLAGIFLAPMTGIVIAACATSLIYAAAHLGNPKHWQWKLPLLFLWGACSILLYSWLHDPFLNFAIHIVGGAILIKHGFIRRLSISKKS